MPPVVFCLCPNCSCYSPVFNISDVGDIVVAAGDEIAAAENDADIVIVTAEGASRMGSNLFGLLSFLVLAVLFSVGKFTEWPTI